MGDAEIVARVIPNSLDSVDCSWNRRPTDTVKPQVDIFHCLTSQRTRALPPLSTTTNKNRNGVEAEALNLFVDTKK
jgi:hypothetical protein